MPLGSARVGMLGSGVAIPDSTVSRDPDDTSGSSADAFGVRFTTTDTWPQIGATISSNTVGVTRAYVYRVSDGALYGDVDISNLSAGDSFTIDLDIDVVTGETYNFVADAEGSTYTPGIDTEQTYPTSSPDGNLTITDPAQGSQSTTGSAANIVTIGNVGFS